MESEKLKINKVLCAILETLDESEFGSIPESYAHLAIEQGGCEPAILIRLMVDGGLVARRPGPVLKITENGRLVAGEIRKHKQTVGA